MTFLSDPRLLNPAVCPFSISPSHVSLCVSRPLLVLLLLWPHWLQSGPRLSACGTLVWDAAKSWPIPHRTPAQNNSDGAYYIIIVKYCFKKYFITSQIRQFLAFGNAAAVKRHE